jgi:hypothetical protein
VRVPPRGILEVLGGEGPHFLAPGRRLMYVAGLGLADACVPAQKKEAELRPLAGWSSHRVPQIRLSTGTLP